MLELPDAPWIEEAERTGHYKYGFWNNPPKYKVEHTCNECLHYVGDKSVSCSINFGVYAPSNPACEDFELY